MLKKQSKNSVIMKPLKDLTLLNKFLFDETMDIPEAHEAALRIILGREDIQLLTPPQTEKEIRRTERLRSIRLDVYAEDQEGTVYDTEMQPARKADLVKRSRYYQGLIDSSLLERGTISFNELNDVCIIMITPFDLFGEGQYVYTFESYCRENKTVQLNDGAVRIFLNTKGKNDQDVSTELIEFLRYIESTDEGIAEQSGNENLKKIHACVSRIKASEEMGVRYMQRWEEEAYWKLEAEEAREKALKEGREETRLADIRNLMDSLKLTADQAMDALKIPEDEKEELKALLS